MDNLSTTRCRQAWRWLLLLGVLSLATWLLSDRALRDEDDVFVDIGCEDNVLTATFNGEGHFVAQLDPALPGARIGLYVFHAFEEEGAQFFRHLDIRPAGARMTMRNRYLLTRPERDAHRFDNLSGWSFDDAHGMTHAGEQGDRIVALLNDFRARDFSLQVELHSAIDAGILVRGADARNGYVVVARPSRNDAFVFRLVDGEPGEIIGFTALHDLQLGSEALRIVRLISALVLKSCVLLLFLCLPVNWLRSPRSGGATNIRPPFEGKAMQYTAVAVLFVVTVAAMASLAQCSLKAMPHLADETAYLFQAKIFANGRLVAPAPPFPVFFEHHHIVNNGTSWFAKYPPVFPALLSIGVRLGCYWMVNPLLGALAALGMFLLARELANARWALIAWVLALTSPFFLMMGANLMSHMTAAMLLTWHLYAVVMMCRYEKLRWAVLAGLCLGLAFMTRPYTAALVGVVVGVFATGQFLVTKKITVVRAGMWLAITCLPFIALYGAWNSYLGGADHVVTGLHGAYDANDTLGFGEEKGKGWLMTWGSWGHTPAKGLRSATQFLEYTSDHLMGWPAQLSFAFLLIPLVACWRPRHFFLLLGAFAALIVGHMCYWATQHIGYGARYWFAAVPGLFILSAVGIGTLMHVEDKPAGEARRGGSLITPRSCIVLLVVTLLVAHNLSTYLPARAREAERYGDVTDALSVALEQIEDRPLIVFIETQELLFNDGFYMNDPFLRGDSLFVQDLGERNVELLEAYPEHDAYVWDKKELVKLTRKGVE